MTTYSCDVTDNGELFLTVGVAVGPTSGTPEANVNAVLEGVPGEPVSGVGQAGAFGAKDGVGTVAGVKTIGGKYALLFVYSLSPERVRPLRVFDPDRTTSSTPREITRLLTLIWRDEAGPPAACAMVRDLMARQLFWTRLPSGFPPEVRVVGKTGTLPGLHIEAGVVEYPDGGRYAIAVFARSQRLDTRRIAIDLAMGEAARAAVEALRAA